MKGTILLAVSALVLVSGCVGFQDHAASYKDCLQMHDLDYCRQFMYDWCVENVNLGELEISKEDLCFMYKTCLLYNDLNYCDSQFFEQSKP